jgi:hypothetical protein
MLVTLCSRLSLCMDVSVCSLPVASRRGVEAEASRQQRQCVDSAEAELSSVRIAAVGAPAAATVVRRSRWRDGGRGMVAEKRE